MLFLRNANLFIHNSCFTSLVALKIFASIAGAVLQGGLGGFSPPRRGGQPPRRGILVVGEYWLLAILCKTAISTYWS